MKLRTAPFILAATFLGVQALILTGLLGLRAFDLGLLGIVPPPETTSPPSALGWALWEGTWMYLPAWEALAIVVSWMAAAWAVAQGMAMLTPSRRRVRAMGPVLLAFCWALVLAALWSRNSPWLDGLLRQELSETWARSPETGLRAYGSLHAWDHAESPTAEPLPLAAMGALLVAWPFGWAVDTARRRRQA